MFRSSQCHDWKSIFKVFSADAVGLGLSLPVSMIERGSCCSWYPCMNVKSTEICSQCAVPSHLHSVSYLLQEGL